MSQVLDRLKARATIDPDSGCWLLKPRPGSQGYAYISVNGKKLRAHRASYAANLVANVANEANSELTFEEALQSIDEAVIRHRCHNRNCVAPTHLRSGTRASNYEDAVRDGRVGEGFKPSLSHSDVIEIYKSDDSSHRLARRYHVSAETIRRIWRGQTWGWITSTLQAGANCAKLRRNRGLKS